MFREKEKPKTLHTLVASCHKSDFVGFGFFWYLLCFPLAKLMLVLGTGEAQRRGFVATEAKKTAWSAGGMVAREGCAEGGPRRSQAGSAAGSSTSRARTPKSFFRTQ